MNDKFFLRNCIPLKPILPKLHHLIGKFFKFFSYLKENYMKSLILKNFCFKKREGGTQKLSPTLYTRVWICLQTILRSKKWKTFNLKIYIISSNSTARFLPRKPFLFILQRFWSPVKYEECPIWNIRNTEFVIDLCHTSLFCLFTYYMVSSEKLFAQRGKT